MVQVPMKLTLSTPIGNRLNLLDLVFRAQSLPKKYPIIFSELR